MNTGTLRYLSRAVRPTLVVGVTLIVLRLDAAFAQDWRADAEARIEAHRMADMRVVVRDADSRLIEGADIEIAMQRHEFKFGTAVESHRARFEPRDDLWSGDLDLGENVSAVRFALDLPQGASILSAYLQFTADKDDQNEETNLTIRAAASDDSPDFDTEGIESRDLTAAAVAWNVPAWPRRGDKGDAQRSPDIGTILQEVVARQGWRTGHAVAFVMKGAGKRSAQTFDQDSSAAAVLHVTFEDGSVSHQVIGVADDAEQTTPDFYGADSERYREEIRRLFNYATLENALKWRPWERDRKLADGTIEWLHAQDIPVRGHAMIWSSWRWNAIPQDIEQRTDDPTFVADRAFGHVGRIAGAYEGTIFEWDVLNEPLHEGDLEQIVGFDERVRWFQTARANDAHARLFVNEFDILENDALLDAYKRLVRDLIDDGAPVEGLGIQGHFLGQPVSPDVLVRRYASLAELGLPIQITEFDMARAWSDAVQEEFMEAILVTSFAEPSVTAFLMWGFWDGNHWLGNAPLYTRDWTLKPAGRVWMDYVFDRWWTTSTTVTDTDGSANVRAFKGEYEVTVSYGGQVRTESVSLLNDSEIIVQLDQIRVSSETEETLFDDMIRNVFPVPAEDILYVEASLGTSSEVRFVLYDLLGRTVWSSRPMLLSQGLHTLRFTPAVSTSGTYLLRFYGASSNSSSATSSFVVFVR